MTQIPKIIRLPENRSGRDFILGDLHGTTILLRALMEHVVFDPGKDRLFSVGDLIDKGKDSPGGLALLRQPWFHAVKGNHEEMMLDYLLMHKFGHGIQNPYSIVFSKSGLIYAANFNEGSIVCLSSSGKVLWSAQKKVSYPYAIALGVKGNLWILNDGNGGSLSKYSPEGKLLKHINGPVSYPYGEAIDEKGNIFIANFNSNSVSEFSSRGKFLGYASKINRPIGIIIGKKGNIWAADGNGNLTKIENVAAGGEYFQFDKKGFPYGR